MNTVKVLGISGSLRTGSYNLAALKAAGEVLPDGMSLEIFELSEIPIFSDDRSRQGFPERVQQFRKTAAGADAILFASPEYNYSISATLKTALEWASRPPDPPLSGKPCAILGASTSPLGTMRGQSHLRQVCSSLNFFPLNAPQVDIPEAQKKFDATGALIDAPTRDLLRTLMKALLDLTLRMASRET